MSEFQHVAFRAVDRPLTDKQLAFAERQSSRAEVSRWAMSVEYHYSEFRGDVNKLLRGGYDVFLQYANYGVREIRMRLPNGLPFDKKTCSHFIDGEHVQWSKDRKGNGGILAVLPFHESDELDEVYEFDDYLESAIALREQLILGDLRPLYLLWMCGSFDDYEDPAESMEPPVPHGLDELSERAIDVLPFFGLDPLMAQAASQGIASVSNQTSPSTMISQWASSLKRDLATELLTRFLCEDAEAVKAELLAEVRDGQGTAEWPTTVRGKSLAEILADCELLRADAAAANKRKRAAKAKREAAKAERERQARMKKMVKSPKKWLTEAEKLADAGGTVNYKAAAEVLADLREAIGGKKGDTLTRRHAAHLTQKHPTLNMLKSSLRKRDLLN